MHSTAATHLTYFTYATVHGPITLGASDRGLTDVVFGTTELPGKLQATSITNEAATQLQEYLAGKRREFSVPLDIQGSAFQQAVFAEVANIAYGSTCTPSDIARNMGKGGSHRSVGTAIKQNRLAPFIPTHRILAPNATGQQAKVFRALVALEKREVDG